jgi:hypothetical protein
MRAIMKKFIEHKISFNGKQDKMIIELPNAFSKLHIPGQLEKGDLTITWLLVIYLSA